MIYTSFHSGWGLPNGLLHICPANRIAQKYGVVTIPSLCVLQNDDNVIVTNNIFTQCTFGARGISQRIYYAP
jgi:hypothetical protein